jgi:hypothetical protein
VGLQTLYVYTFISIRILIYAHALVYKADSYACVYGFTYEVKYRTQILFMDRVGIVNGKSVCNTLAYVYTLLHNFLNEYTYDV